MVKHRVSQDWFVEDIALIGWPKELIRAVVLLFSAVYTCVLSNKRLISSSAVYTCAESKCSGIAFVTRENVVE